MALFLLVHTPTLFEIFSKLYFVATCSSQFGFYRTSKFFFFRKGEGRWRGVSHSSRRVASMCARAYYFRSCWKNDRYYIAPATGNYQVSLRSEKFIAPYSTGKYTRRAMSKHEKRVFFWRSKVTRSISTNRISLVYMKRYFKHAFTQARGPLKKYDDALCRRLSEVLF